MEINTRESDGVNIVSLEGSLDTGSAPIVGGKFDELVDGGALKILVIFTTVDFVSSAGLRVLLATTKKLRKSNGDLRLCSLNETVQEVFEISGFNSIIKIFEDESRALEGF